MKRLLLVTVPVILACALPGCSTTPVAKRPIRVAVIGGMIKTGLWQEIAKRFSAESGFAVDLAMTGNREVLATAFREGQADVLTMHSGDISTDLVADGFATNLRPWTRNEFVIVGPRADPAGIRGLRDGAA